MNCCSLGTSEQKNKLSILLANAKKYNYGTIKVLEQAQEIYGYLPEMVIKEIAKTLGKSVGEIYSVASFYSEFSFVPKGKFPISVCLGTACYVKGSGEIYNKICMLLQIKEGECTSDGRFSIDQTRCVGCCGMAPVMVIGEEVYGNLKLEDIERILAKYKEK